MNDVEERRTPEERLATAILLTLSMCLGVMVFAAGALAIQFLLTTWELSTRLLAGALLLPLSIATIRLAAYLLGACPSVLSLPSPNVKLRGCALLRSPA